MEDTLRELCREARDRQNITIQDLADETGISISTIGNFFASKSKAPNVYNAGAICAALGVSLDEYFGIEPVITTEDELTHANDQLKHQKQLHDADVRIAHLEGGMEQMAKPLTTTARNRGTQNLLFMALRFCAPCLWLLSWDISFLTTASLTWGLFRAGRPVYSHGSSFCCLPPASAFLPPFL